jgi:DNA mismatch repair protein MutS
VIARARERLRELEDGAHRHATRETQQLSLFPMEPAPRSKARLEPEPVEPPVCAALRDIDPDELTPREALERLYHLRGMLESREPSTKVEHKRTKTTTSR